jgi:hypothetical protein
MADLRFLDNSNLSVGPLDNSYTTRIGLPVAVERRPAARLVCRGGAKPRNYQIKTPYGTLGVRG